MILYIILLSFYNILHHFTSFYYHFINILYRYQALCDKPKNQPVFNAQSDEYKKHVKIECDYENCSYLYNNGFAPPLIHCGNLGVEQVNSMIKMYVIIILLSFYYHFII